MHKVGLLLTVALASGPFISSSAAAATGRDYGTRSPSTCAHVKAQPNRQQMAALVQCSSEAYLSGYITLLDQVKVQPGIARAYDPRTDGNHQGIDIRAKVIPIRGSEVNYVCEPVTGLSSANTGKNCSMFIEPHAQGECWQSTSGYWQCQMGEITGTPDSVNQPPPKF